MFLAFRALGAPIQRSSNNVLYGVKCRALSLSAVYFAGSTPTPQSPVAKFKEKGGDKRSMSERLSLRGKTTVITGGGRGIGLSLAEAAAEAGSDVAILDVLEEPQIDVSSLSVQARYYR